MALPTTYDELNSQIQAWLEDNDADFTGNVVDIIALGNRRLWADLKIEFLDGRVEGQAYSASQYQLTRPTAAIAVKAVFLSPTAGGYITLDRRPIEYCKDYNQGFTTTGTPKYWAELDATTILIVPAADGAGTYDMEYVASIEELASGGDPNYHLTHWPDLLFYACLIEAEAFLIEDTRVGSWNAVYQDRLSQAQEVMHKSTRPTLTSRVLQSESNPPDQNPEEA